MAKEPKRVDTSRINVEKKEELMETDKFKLAASKERKIKVKNKAGGEFTVSMAHYEAHKDRLTKVK